MVAMIKSVNQSLLSSAIVQRCAPRRWRPASAVSCASATARTAVARRGAPHRAEQPPIRPAGTGTLVRQIAVAVKIRKIRWCSND